MALQLPMDPFEAAVAKLEEPDYQRDVYQWAAHKLDVWLWSLSNRIAELKVAHKRVAVPACHDSSKSWTAALLACHHIDTYPVGEARVVTTAPSHTQVRAVLWGEINKMFEMARELGNPFPGKVNQMDWMIGKWQAGVGRKPNDYKPEVFAGLHARYPFLILDEADGLPTDMWDGVEALMTNRKAKMLAIANPLDPGSRFAHILQDAQELGDDSEWVVMRIPYDQTPNFSGEIDTIPIKYRELLQDNLLDPDWVEAKRKEWGGDKARKDPTYQPDHPFWYGRVLAIHPPASQHVIIKPHTLIPCREPDSPFEPIGVRELGVDVAASDKGDMTVCRERVGAHVLRKWTLQSGDDDQVIDFIVDCAKTMDASIVCFDATGLGTFVTGRLRVKLPNVAIIPVNFQAAATERYEDGSKKYKNLRAQLWWRGREMSENHEWDLSLAEDWENLEGELVAAQYVPSALSSKRLVQVEDKDEIRKRLGKSPDDADATLLSMYTGGAGGIGTMHSPREYTIPIGASSVVRR